MAYISMCDPKGCGILAAVVSNRVRFLHSSFELRMFYKSKLIPIRPSTKALHNAFTIGLNWGTNYNRSSIARENRRVRSKGLGKRTSPILLWEYPRVLKLG